MNLKLKIDDDLIKHLKHKDPMFNGVRYVFDFGNGYGASVIKHMGSYGHLIDEWEVACMFEGKLTYPKLMDGDVLGYLSDEEVNRLLRLIRDKKLDKCFYDVEEDKEVQKKMNDVCGDNRFELIKKYKERLIDSTNIEMANDEMKVIDDILFRFWQMGWIDKLDKVNELEEALDNACNYIFDTGYGCPTSENFDFENRMDEACERCIVDTDSISYKHKGVKCWKKLFMKEVENNEKR